MDTWRHAMHGAMVDGVGTVEPWKGVRPCFLASSLALWAGIRSVENKSRCSPTLLVETCINPSRNTLDSLANCPEAREVRWTA